jgi:pimeloyl-ACP methyl ester carboxylesterase
MWQPTVEHMAEFHCLVPDLPEQGQSTKLGPFRITDAAGLVADLIRERAHNGRAHIVGLSLGAQVTIAILANAPELVQRAILTGALVRPLPGARLTGSLLRLYAPFKNISWLVEANRRAYDVPDALAEAFRQDSYSLSATAMGRVMAENIAFRLPARLNRARAATLVVVGQKEYGIMKQSARDLVIALPHGHGVIAEGQRHNWPLAAPKLAAHLIRGWIAAQPLPKGFAPLAGNGNRQQ